MWGGMFTVCFFFLIFFFKLVFFYSGTFTPKLSPNEDMKIPEAVEKKAIKKCQIIRHTSKSMGRLVMKPFRFKPRMGPCTEEESERRGQHNQRRKRQYESMAQQLRFECPPCVMQFLDSHFVDKVCKDIFGVETE